jgi:hypothetical protein
VEVLQRRLHSALQGPTPASLNPCDARTQLCDGIENCQDGSDESRNASLGCNRFCDPFDCPSLSGDNYTRWAGVAGRVTVLQVRRPGPGGPAGLHRRGGGCGGPRGLQELPAGPHPGFV